MLHTGVTTTHRSWQIVETEVSGSRTYKPNSVRSKNAAGRSFLWDAHYCAPQATYPEVVTRRASTCPRRTRVPPYLVLLRVGFALPAALLRRRCALTAPFHPYPALLPGGMFSVALSVERP